MPRQQTIRLRRDVGTPADLLDGEPAIDLNGARPRLFAGVNGTARLIADHEAYVLRAGDTMTGVLTMEGQGITYPAAGGHNIAFGWDGGSVLCSVDGSGTPGALATRAYTDGTFATVGYVNATFLPLTGGTLNNGGSDPLIIRADGANAARIFYWNDARLWTAGVVGSGTFAIADESASAVRLTLDTAGNITLAGNTSVNGDLAVTGQGIRYFGTAGADIHRFAFGWDGRVLCSVDGTGTPGALAAQSYVDGAFLPLTGGRLTGSLTVDGALIAHTTGGCDLYGNSQSLGNFSVHTDLSVAGTSYLQQAQAYRPGLADPMGIYADAGLPARARFTVLGWREWTAGCASDGMFRIADESAGRVGLQIDTTVGAVYCPHSISTYGGVTTQTSGFLAFGGNMTLAQPGAAVALRREDGNGDGMWVGNNQFFIGSIDATGAPNTGYFRMMPNGEINIDNAELHIRDYSLLVWQGHALKGAPPLAWEQITLDEPEDVAPYTAGLAQIAALKPITYRLPDRDGVFHGLDYDAAAAAMPEMTGMATVQRRADEPAQPHKTLTIDPMFYALVNAIKELAHQVEALTGRVAALEGS